MSNGNQTSLLAKLLATENITVQQTPGIKTAMFDLKGRVLMLPLWHGISNDLQDLLIVHETGHALDTPDADTYKKAYEDLAAKIFPNEKISDQLKKTVQGFLNCVEDARIDKRQKRRYPGSRKNYLIGYKELMERDFFGTARKDINTMNFIDRLNMYFKGGNINMNIQFSPEEKVFLKRCEGLETFDEVVALTEEIYLYCKDKLEKQQEMEQDLLAGESDDEEEGEDNDYSDFDDNDGDDLGDDDGEGKGEDEDETDSDQGKSEKSSDALTGEGDIQDEGTGTGAGADNDALPDNAPVSETDETWQKKSQEIVKDENCSYIYLNMPQVNWEKAVHDYKKVLEDWRGIVSHHHFDNKEFLESNKELTEWKMKEKETVSFLVKEFEAKKAAEMYARISIAKTGVIDTNKLHSYKYNDDIFRRLTVLPQGKNHGFIMFLDWSGSMMYGLKNTLKQLFSLCLFCKQIGVPFEVYAFRDCGAENPFTYIGQQNVIGGSEIVMRNFLSSRMNVQELNFAMNMLWHSCNRGRLWTDGMGGTPLNHAIMIAPKLVEDFRAKNKLQIVNTIFLTDGDSNAGNGVANETVPTYGLSHERSRDKRYFYVDPVSRKTYDFAPWGWEGTRQNTNTLLRILKDRTGCNLVGFYLYTYSFKRLVNDFNLYSAKLDETKKYWTDNKFINIKSAGYDEYYVIDSSSLGNNANVLKIDNTGEKKMTVRKMASEFSKFAMKKTVNRVLLRQFVERIANQSKKVA